jgi:hypothetical protein
MVNGPKHDKASIRLAVLLESFYDHIEIEEEIEVPNPKYILGDRNASKTINYYFDVFCDGAQDCECHSYTYNKIGIEIDGSIGHKRTKRQHYRDKHRTNTINEYMVDVRIIRFDTEELTGKGYINPKTKKLTPILDDTEILERCGIYGRNLKAGV